MPLNQSAFNSASFNGGASSLVKQAAAVAALGFVASASITVTQPAYAEGRVETISHALAIGVETNGVGQALTNFDVTGVGTRYVLPVEEFSISFNSPPLFAKVTRHVDSAASLEIRSEGSIRRDTWGIADASYLDYAMTADGTRVLRGLGSQINIDASGDVTGSLVHYVDSQATLVFSSIAAPYHIKKVTVADANISVNTIQAGAIVPAPMVMQFDSWATGLTIIGFRSESNVNVEGQADIWLLSNAKGQAEVVFESAGEPGINGVHSASAKGSFGFKVEADDALVRSNTYGLASMKLNSTARAWSLLQFAGNGAINFTAAELSGDVVTQFSGASVINVSSSIGTVRTRLARANPNVRFNSFEFASVTRGLSAEGVISISGLADFMTLKPFEALGELSVNGYVIATRVVLPSESAVVSVNTERADMLSNLTQPATRDKTFIVPTREAHFIVPEREQVFIV